jgi:hypothetical protein
MFPADSVDIWSVNRHKSVRKRDRRSTQISGDSVMFTVNFRANGDESAYMLRMPLGEWLKCGEMRI